MSVSKNHSKHCIAVTTSTRAVRGARGTSFPKPYLPSGTLFPTSNHVDFDEIRIDLRAGDRVGAARA
jgi:hypothetical protein